MSPRRNSLY